MTQISHDRVLSTSSRQILYLFPRNPIATDLVIVLRSRAFNLIAIPNRHWITPSHRTSPLRQPIVSKILIIIWLIDFAQIILHGLSLIHRLIEVHTVAGVGVSLSSH